MFCLNTPLCLRREWPVSPDGNYPSLHRLHRAPVKKLTLLTLHLRLQHGCQPRIPPPPPACFSLGPFLCSGPCASTIPRKLATSFMRKRPVVRRSVFWTRQTTGNVCETRESGDVLRDPFGRPCGGVYACDYQEWNVTGEVYTVCWSPVGTSADGLEIVCTVGTGRWGR